MKIKNDIKITAQVLFKLFHGVEIVETDEPRVYMTSLRTLQHNQGGGESKNNRDEFIQQGRQELYNSVESALGEQIYSKRVIEPFDIEKRRQITLFNRQILLEYEALKNSTLQTFENSNNFAKKILKHFENLQTLAIFVFALTQSGKTGLMRALIKIWCECVKNLMINASENIYLITGMSSKDWCDQMAQRFPKVLKENIYHRGQLKGKSKKDGVEKFCKSIKGKRNCLILIDEVQLAAGEKQTLAQAFKEIGIFEPAYCFENDIKIVEVSATPDGVGMDLADKWPDDNYKFMMMDPGPGHTSQRHYYDTLKFAQDARRKKKVRLFQYKDFVNVKKKKRGCPTEYDDEKSERNIREYKQLIAQRFGDTPRYHLYRQVRDKKYAAKELENMKKYGFSESEFEYKEYYGTTTKKDWGLGIGTDEEDYKVNINDDLLKHKPQKHTIILVKDLLTASHTIHKEYIGSAYERWTKNVNDTLQIQGFPGRLTGYDVPGDIILFTNINTFERYFQIVEKQGNLKEANVFWSSTTTKNTKLGCQTKKPTMNSHINGKKKSSPSIQNKETPKDDYRVYKDKTIVVKVLELIGATFNKSNNFDDDGFYRISLNDKSKKRTLQETINKVPGTYGTNNGVKGYTNACRCYTDIDDNTSLVYVVPLINPKYTPEIKARIFEEFKDKEYKF